MKKVIKILAISLVLILVLSFAIGLTVYLFNKDYIQGVEKHYVGESIITPMQAVALGANISIGKYESGVKPFEILEDGMVKVKYDFYSKSDFDYLNYNDFNLFEIPSINDFIDGENLYLLFLIPAIFSVAILIMSQSNKSVRATSILWYLLHLKHIGRQNPPINYQRFPPIIRPVNINPVIDGIFGVRTWKVKDGILYSAGAGQTKWDDKVVFTNKQPDEKNENGLYVFRLGVVNFNQHNFFNQIIGIVSLSGEWLEHDDGVVRAERCEILHLIVQHYNSPIAKNLSSYYGVPVTICDNTIYTYQDWLFNQNGIACLTHNAEILKEK